MAVRVKRINKDGTKEVEAVCDCCGKPLTITNEFGMFCEDRCGEKESKKAAKLMDKMLDFLGVED